MPTGKWCWGSKEFYALTNLAIIDFEIRFSVEEICQVLRFRGIQASWNLTSQANQEAKYPKNS